MKSSAPIIEPIRVGRNSTLKYFAVFGIKFQKPIVKAGKVIKDPPPATALIALASAPRAKSMRICPKLKAWRLRSAPANLPSQLRLGLPHDLCCHTSSPPYPKLDLEFLESELPAQSAR